MFLFERLQVSSRLLLAAISIALGLMLVAGYTLMEIRAEALAAHSDRIKNLVEAARGLIGNYQRLETEHMLSRSEAQRQAREALRILRFGRDDYYFLYDFDGRALMVAGAPEFEGKVLLGHTDAAGFKMWDALVQRGKEGQGYFDYVFPRAGQTESKPKRAYVIGIPEWGWIVGTGVYVDDVDEAVRNTALNYSLLSLLILAIAGATAYFFSPKIVTQVGGQARDTQGRIHHYMALFSDLSALQAHQLELEHTAHYDALTALPNRVLLGDRLHQAMVQEQRRQQRLAVVYLDLDGFKAVNDVYGHGVGDQLLIHLSGCMKQSLREGDTLARLGGDEFVAVLLDLDDAASCLPLLDRLLLAAAQPLRVGELVLQVSASLGVSFFPQADEVNADQLLRQADQAMYQAKLSGKNRYHLFDADHDRNLRGLHESLERIRLALTAKEFVLHYQPKVNMRSGKVIGAEALIRWQHPERGLLLPAVFLPVIENNSLAVEVGEWVIDTTLGQMQRWQAAGLSIPVSVNVGSRQLQSGDFAQRLSRLLAAHPSIRPGDLEIEVLETSALDDVAQVSRLIEDCRELGVSFSLDDFGTGYSSLTYLKRLSVAQLKIDQSFVHDMLDNPDDLAILEGILGLATAFQRQVIAEGVETVDHGRMLLQLGCELAQGYGIARPMPPEDFPGWALTWQPDPAWSTQRTIGHDDVQVLVASTEHRAWVLALEKFIKGEHIAPPTLDIHRCRFGVWLDGDGRQRHGMQTVFPDIESAHRQLHTLAAELLGLQALGRKSEALSRLSELHEMRKTLFDQLQALLKETHTSIPE